MKIDAEKWAELRAAVIDDDQERFCKLVWAFTHEAVHHEAARKKAHDAARSRERGNQPYAVWQR